MSYKTTEGWCHSPAAKRILAWLSEPSKSRNQRVIGEALGLKPQTVRSLSSRLAKHGYIRKTVELTAAGRELLDG